MALIVCPECANQVSDSAGLCPACGYPIASAVRGAEHAPSAPATGERVLWKGRASMRAALPAFLRFLFASALVIVLFHVVLGRLPEWVCATSSAACKTLDTRWFEQAWTYAVWVELAVLGLLLLGLLRAILVVKAIHVTISNQRIVSEWGIVAKQVDELDMRIVRDTAYSQGPLERILGIGRITVISGDPSHPQLVLRGLEDPRALRELIRTHAYQLTQGQGFVRVA